MISTEISIYKLIATADYWRSSGSGFTAHLSFTKGSQTFYTIHSVPTEQLEQLHPLLPKLLNAIIKARRQDSMPDQILGEHIQPTLDILTGNFVEFTDTSACPRIVSSLSNLTKVFRRDDRVLMTGGTHTTTTIEVEGVLLRHVTATRRIDTVVMTTELEQRYPGWEQRWNIASELDVELKDMLPLLFPRHPVLAPTPAMNNIHFE